jgi:hypothetical protein
MAAAGGLALAGLLAAGCGASAGTRQGGGARPAATVAPAGTTSPSASPAVARRAWPVIVPVPSARPGQHQTSVRPPATSRVFRAEMTDLWAAIAAGRPALGLAAFFPVVAYEQVKAVGDPAADWRDRLVAEYRLDVGAAHALLHGHGRQARLVRVIVPEQEADWIGSGDCDNSLGYWHVAGARLVYRAGGRTRSIGIATLISWRGRWYVVHLGGEVRDGDGGMVDAPAAGPGIPGPPGGC